MIVVKERTLEDELCRIFCIGMVFGFAWCLLLAMLLHLIEFRVDSLVIATVMVFASYYTYMKAVGDIKKMVKKYA